MKAAWRFLRSPLLSPSGFAARAVWIALAFAICHVAGWRDDVSFLSGTEPAGAAGREMGVFLGVAYLATYFAFVLGVPILLIGAGVFVGMERMGGKRRSGSAVD